MEERKLNSINNYQILHIEPRGSKNVVVAKMQQPLRCSISHLNYIAVFVLSKLEKI